MDLNRDVERVQLVYARWMDAGTQIGLTLLVCGFFAYASGLVEPLVPLAELPGLWGLPLDEFIARTGAPTGWAWLEFWSRGDYLNLFGIALLSSIALAGFVRILPLLAHRDRTYALIAAAQAAVLLLATSGLLH